MGWGWVEVLVKNTTLVPSPQPQAFQHAWAVCYTKAERLKVESDYHACKSVVLANKRLARFTERSEEAHQRVNKISPMSPVPEATVRGLLIDAFNHRLTMVTGPMRIVHESQDPVPWKGLIADPPVEMMGDPPRGIRVQRDCISKYEGSERGWDALTWLPENLEAPDRAVGCAGCQLSAITDRPLMGITLVLRVEVRDVAFMDAAGKTCHVGLLRHVDVPSAVMSWEASFLSARTAGFVASDVPTKLTPDRDAHLPVCTQCGTKETAANGSSRHRRCGRCRVTYYCGRECQTAHWPAHKLKCTGV